MVPADEIAVIAGVTVSDVASTMAYTTEELRAAQMEDPCVGLVLMAKEANHHPDTITNEASECQRLWQVWNQLTVRNGLLHRLFNDQSDDRCWLQLILPSKFRSEVLASLHEGVAGGHLGQEKTFNRVKERFYWPGYYKDVCSWCQTCVSCATRKQPPATRRAPLGTIAAHQPAEIMAMDILGPFPESERGNSYIYLLLQIILLDGWKYSSSLTKRPVRLLMCL